MIKSFKLLSLSLLSVTIVAMLMSAQNVGAATNNTENTTVSSIESNNTSYMDINYSGVYKIKVLK